MAEMPTRGIVRAQHKGHFDINTAAAERVERRSGPEHLQSRHGRTDKRSGALMALAQNINDAAGHGLGHRIADLFAAFEDARQRRRVYRQTLRELNGLTTRELADLGLHRSMITRVAFEAAYGK